MSEIVDKSFKIVIEEIEKEHSKAKVEVEVRIKNTKDKALTKLKL